jgi:two-component system, sensor histidine kinase PdtaS
LYRQAYTGNIDMNAFITEIAHNADLAFQRQNKGAATKLAIDDIQLDEDRAIPLGLITNELLTNVYKYTQPPASGRLEIKVQMILEGGKYQLLISDNGSPWDVQAARQRKKGLGLLLVDMLTKQLKASWQSRREGEDTIHSISFSNV